MEKSWERSSALPLHLGVVAIEKGAFWSPSSKGRQLYFYLIDMHSASASMWALTKFSYSTFGVKASNISWRASNLFLSVIVNLSLISLLLTKNQSYCVGFGCLCCIPAYAWTYLCCDNSVIGKHTFKRWTCLTIQSAINPSYRWGYNLSVL